MFKHVILFSPPHTTWNFTAVWIYCIWWFIVQLTSWFQFHQQWIWVLWLTIHRKIKNTSNATSNWYNYNFTLYQNIKTSVLLQIVYLLIQRARQFWSRYSRYQNGIWWDQNLFKPSQRPLFKFFFFTLNIGRENFLKHSFTFENTFDKMWMLRIKSVKGFQAPTEVRHSPDAIPANFLKTKCSIQHVTQAVYVFLNILHGAGLLSWMHYIQWEPRPANIMPLKELFVETMACTLCLCSIKPLSDPNLIPIISTINISKQISFKHTYFSL